MARTGSRRPGATGPFHASAVRPVEERRDRIVEDWAELVLRTGTDDDLAAVDGETPGTVGSAAVA